MTNPYGLDDTALTFANLAFNHTVGSLSQQLQAALAAYVFAVDARQIRWGSITYPTWEAVEDFISSAQQEGQP